MIEQLYAWIVEQLAQNELLAGGIGITAFGSLLYALRSLPAYLWQFALRQWTIELTVYSEDEVFVWINEWLAWRAGRTSRRLKLSSLWRDGEERWSLAPGIGHHLVWRGSTPVWLHREITEGEMQRRETITLRVLGRRQDHITAVLAEAMELKDRTDRVDVFAYRGSYWDRAARKLRRDIETVVLPTEQLGAVVSDAEWFFAARNWYVDRGVPYRRGYLLSGPPGCGKTSLAFALASHFNRPLYTINLGSLLGDNSLLDAFASVPETAILLIEDIDAAQAAKSRQSGAHQARETRAKGDPPAPKDEPKREPISMSALLNAIDGVLASDGRLLLMTTNHPEKLDPAVVRSGRIDRQEHIGPLAPQDARRLFERFYPDRVDLSASFERAVQTPMPAADLQGLFMRHPNDPAGAIETLSGDR